MKPSALPIVTIVLIFLLAALPVLAVLQYSWLGQVADAERSRLQRSAQRAALEFSSDLGREFAVVRTLFEIAAPDYESQRWEGFDSQYEFWKEHTRFPDLVESIELYDTTAGTVREYVPGQGFGEPRALGDAVLDLAENSIVVPVQRVGGALVVIEVDLDYVSGTVIPAVAQDHFGPSSPNPEFALEVYRPEVNDVIFQSTNLVRRDGRSGADAGGNQAGLVTWSVGSGGVSWPGLRLGVVADADGDVTVEAAGLPARIDTPVVRQWFILSGGGEPRSGDEDPAPFLFSDRGDRIAAGAAALQVALPNAAGALQLRVNHVAGSLESAVEVTRMRNLGVSFGILFVLGLGLLVLFILYRRAERLSRQEREFVASVSHELRTPIAALYAAGENLEAGLVSGDAVPRYGGLIRREGDRLRSMIDKVLGYSTVIAGAGRGAEAGPDVELEPVASRVFAVFQEDARRLGISLEHRGCSARVPLDAGALEMVLTNLVSNALRHGKGATRVELAAETRSGRLEISVSDDGPGVPRRESRSVFEPFYRGRRSVADQVPGTGIGLSLVRRIVESRNGRIRLEPSRTGGARFVIRFPLGGTKARYNGAPAAGSRDRTP